MLSPNFQTLALNFMIVSVEKFARIGDVAGQCGRSDRRRRAHEHFRARIAHTTLEVARGRRDAHLVRPNDTHMTAAARSASRRTYHRTGLDELLDRAALDSFAINELRGGNDKESYAWGHPPAGDYGGCELQVIERAIRARADVRLIDLH